MQKQLKRILRLVPLLQTHHSDFPPNGLQIFTLVAMNEGISSTELVEKLDAPKATVSRNLRMLGDRMSPTKNGMGLVSLRHDPKDYRVRRAYITEKGQTFLDELLEALA
jgi:DNA-binding MarR family transcriptional regulator